MLSVTLHPGTAALDYVETLLERNDLPVRDVRTHPADFHYATADGERIGVGGLEHYGTVGLLRSLVVEAGKRGNGYGHGLCEALESKARANGIETLYLLTTTASGFFAARQYAPIDRTAAPDVIRNTTEFAELCPATATCLRKSL